MAGPWSLFGGLDSPRVQHFSQKSLKNYHSNCLPCRNYLLGGKKPRAFYCNAIFGENHPT